MSNGDPRDGFFYPTFSLMINSYFLYYVIKPNGKQVDTAYYRYVCVFEKKEYRLARGHAGFL